MNRKTNERDAYRRMVMLAAAVVGTGIASATAQATSIFSDNFNSGSLVGDTNWSAPVTVSGSAGTADGGATIASVSGSNVLELTNDINGYTSTANSTTTGTARGRTYLSADPFSTSLDLSSGLVTWTFNIEQNDSSNPAGFNYYPSGNYGAAVILAAFSSDFKDGSDDNGTAGSANTDQGYALAWGSTSSDLALVKFSGGLSGTSLTASPFTTIIDGGTTFVKGDYLSVKVTLDPSTNGWSLYVSNDGTSFTDPTALSTPVNATPVVDSTYTSETLPYFGPVWNYSNGPNGGAGYAALFGNFNIDVASAPEPTAVAGLSAVGVAVLLRRPRRRAGRRA